MRPLSAAAVLSLAWNVHAAELGVMETVEKAKAFYDGTFKVFEGAEKSLRADGNKDKADKVAKWASDWLSILGISTGVTGLVKDYVMNYLGRSSYHDNNKYLLDALKTSGRVISEEAAKAKAEDKDTKIIQQKVTKICDEGKKLFAEGGSLHIMLNELGQIISDDKTAEHMVGALSDLGSLFKWLTGAAPVTQKELEALDDDDDDDL
eukprot:gnl/MRDRNA2_/MRDRNA2_91588_c0_seq1.p1 gnl/MRDRNA2_/MRDRNA2_91588_c0~~gnl/MRDRNA2_/MRDRNA2_91588_c0_seq1.p1  ORF type:complete len:230 (+),score=64.81 gnl/MRDRNA2_/MRDRNA2_91588_c0_seq1:70-690(+)